MLHRLGFLYLLLVHFGFSPSSNLPAGFSQNLPPSVNTSSSTPSSNLPAGLLLSLLPSANTYSSPPPLLSSSSSSSTPPSNIPAGHFLSSPTFLSTPLGGTAVAAVTVVALATASYSKPEVQRPPRRHAEKKRVIDKVDHYQRCLISDEDSQEKQEMKARRMTPIQMTAFILKVNAKLVSKWTTESVRAKIRAWAEKAEANKKGGAGRKADKNRVREGGAGRHVDFPMVEEVYSFSSSSVCCRSHSVCSYSFSSSCLCRCFTGK